ncbi:MAG: long-chain fatty acid--CoA ligase [Dehalococcoidia bacterium]|nr:long-chain fatty acid--CoA ligase [Dehalococcoidia bacterium]
MSIQWLLDRMQTFGDGEAIIWKGDRYTYKWLLDRVKYWETNLSSNGVGSGQVVVIEGDFSPNISALLLALIGNKNIVVPLSSSLPEKQKEQFVSIAEAQVKYTFDSDDGFQFEALKKRAENALILELQSTNEPGLILFSSGSTGKSKAVLHNFTKLLEKYRTPRPAFRMIIFLLFDHIGGVNTFFHILSNGGCIVAVDERSPEGVCKAIEAFKVEILPTSPTFLNLLLISEQYRYFDLSSLKRITYGTEPMPESTLKKVHEVLPDVQLQQTYGLSELGILRSKSKSSDSLWVKIGGENYQTKVVDGLLYIKTDSAMLGYLNAPSPFDEDGWFNTEDQVEVDGEYMRILGRKSDIINVGGEKVYPAEVESVLLEMDGVTDVAVTGEPNPILGQIVKARVNLGKEENISELKKRIREFCKGRLEQYKIPVKVEIAGETQFSARFKRMRR